MGTGNAAKRVRNHVPPPWRKWRVKSRVARCIKFVETFCRPPKGYGAGQTLRLAGFQRDWLEEALAPGVSAAAMELPRSNGKSTFLAGVGSWALFDEDDGGAPQVPVVATTIRQAVRSVYGVAESMIGACPELESRSIVYSGMGTQRIACPYNGGEMFPVSNDPDGLQGLDPSLGICDEIGFMPIESWTSLVNASGKRPRSLVVGIGTPGFDRDSALWHLREQSRSGVLLPGFFFTEFAADEGCSILDEAQWRKANPAVGAGFKNLVAMRSLAAISPEAHFRIFQLGQWIDGVECWLGVDGGLIWRRLADPYAFEPDASTWAGVDVAQTNDTTAIVWCQKRPDGRTHFKCKIWHPQPDGRLDVTDAMQFLRELDSMYDLKSVAFDPKIFELPAQQLLDEGLPMVEFPQVLERMTPAVVNCHQAIKRGEVSHDGDEDFEYQVLNAVSRYNERGFTISKSKSKNKIDAAVSMVMAMWEATRIEEPATVPLGAWG